MENAQLAERPILYVWRKSAGLETLPYQLRFLVRETPYHEGFIT